MLARPVAVSLALAFAALPPASAEAYCRMSTSASTGTATMPCVLCEDDDPAADCLYLYWERPCMSVAIDRPGARDFELDELRGIVEQSVAPWLAVECPGGRPGFQVTLIDQLANVGVAEYNVDAGNINAITFVDDWAERDYDPTAYALTTVWHSVSTGRIYDSDIEVNENRGTYTVCPDRTGCDDGRIDLRNVLTHEFGHFFGLGHSLESFATMHAISPPGEVTKRILRTDDVSGFCEIYPAPLGAECDFEPRGGMSLEQGGGGGGCCAVAGASSRSDLGGVAAALALALLGLRRLRRRR